MAKRAQPISGIQALGGAFLLIAALLVIVPLIAVALRAEGLWELARGDWQVIRFTLLQAGLSALVSCLAAIPVARALARRNFRGRQVFVTLLGAPFILPVIVAVLGLLAVFGRAGWLNSGLAGIGLEPIDIYGLPGIVLAHTFLNLPLATRLLLQGWLSIPAERMRLARSLGFHGRDILRHFERPLLRAVLPGTALLVFLMCTTSFAVALILGGGPSATTVELAIYQAFRFEFDLDRAALLGLCQIVICISAGAFVFLLPRPDGMGSGLDRAAQPWAGDGYVTKVQDVAVLIAAGLFLLLPLGAVFINGATALLSLPESTWEAALRSIFVALASTGLAVGFALPIALLIGGRRSRAALEGIGLLSISVSPLVVGTGLFILVAPFANPVAVALPITALVNALIALPFLLRGLTLAVTEAEVATGRLADALGLKGLARLRHAIIPRLLRPLGFGAGLAAAFSMGDLGVIALFSAPDQATLPLEMFRLFGSYRTDDAEGAALLLVALSLSLFWLFDRGGRAFAPT